MRTATNVGDAEEAGTVSDYSGIIIEESLGNTAVLKKVRITSTQTEKVTKGHRTPWVSQWTLHTVEIPEAHVEDIAWEVSEALDTEHDGSWYADFKNDEQHVVIFHNRVFLIDRRSDAQYEEARQYGLSLGIPEYQLDFKPKSKQWER